MSEWNSTLISEIVEFNPENIGKHYPYNEITYLDISSVGVGSADFGNIIDFSQAPSRAKRLVKKGDVILATVRPGNKSYYFINDIPENTVVSTGFAVLRAKKEYVFPRFLYYLVTDPKFTGYLVANEQGANYPAVTPDIIGRGDVEIPSLPTQRRIASILSAYDDLIENNLKRIKLLEELAQRTYEEWFVKFRIPGKDLKLNEETGLPEGWEKRKIGEFVEYEIGGGWGEEELSEEFSELAYVIRGTDMNKISLGQTTEVPLRFHKFSNLKSRKLVEGDIIFEVSGGSQNEGVAKTLLCTSNLLSQFKEDVMCASFCKLLRPNSLDMSYFLFHFLRFLRKQKQTEVFEIRSASNIVNYNWTAFLAYQDIKIPSEKFLKKFKDFVGSIHNESTNLATQNRLLKESRDLLLTRLMSGAIHVDAAEEQLGLVAEEREQYKNQKLIK